MHNHIINFKANIVMYEDKKSPVNEQLFRGRL